MSILETTDKINSITLKIKDDASSMISIVTWRNDDVLIVSFKNNNSTYRYKDVSSHVFSEMINNESIGKYFCKEIKPNYEAEKVEIG